jgi:hypothetical protein
MQYEPRSYDLLNVCRYGDAIRSQCYAQAQTNSATPGNEIRISLPNNEICDLSNSYIDFDLSPVNAIAAVDLQFTIQSNITVNAGTWELLFNGQAIGGNDTTHDSFNYGSNGSQVRDQLNAFEPFKSRGYVASLVGADVPISTGFKLNIALSGYYGDVLTGDEFAVIGDVYSSPGATGASVPVIYTVTQAAVSATPRFEKTLPIVNRLYVNLNSTTIIDINDCNKLQAILSFTDSTFDVVGKYLSYPYVENGLYVSKIKAKIDLSFIDLYQSILPLDLMNNAQLTIYLQLEQPNVCLVCSNSTNSANQSYLVENIKLKYHRLQLGSAERALISAKINSGSGLVIPFKNWTTLKTTVSSANANIIFNPNRKNFLGCYFVMLQQAYYQDATNPCKLTTFLRNNMQNFRLKLGNLYFPLDYAECSNSYYAIVEAIELLKDFTQLVKLKIINGDMECLNNYTGIGYIGNDPNDLSYVPWLDLSTHMKCISAVATCDLGFSDKSKLCSRLVMQGVDTSSLPNTILEINGMNIQSVCDIIIYSYSQDYLVVKSNSFEWLK